MPYYKITDYTLIGYEKATRKRKMYNALLERETDKKIIRVPFGDNQMQNYHDLTGLNLYPHLIHGDKERRRRFRIRSKGYLKAGYYSPSYFSFYCLW
jgi:hypothetical protein